MSQRRVTVEEARELARSVRGNAWASRRQQEKEAAKRRRERYATGTEPVCVLLPWPPALNRYYRTTVSESGKPITYIDKPGTNYRKLIIHIWESIGVTFTGRLAIRVKATYPDARERDLDGLPKCLFDSLQHAGAFEKDSQIRLMVLEQEAIESPGWVDVKLGHKPCERQGTLFDVDF